MPGNNQFLAVPVTDVSYVPSYVEDMGALSVHQELTRINRAVVAKMNEVCIPRGGRLSSGRVRQPTV